MLSIVTTLEDLEDIHYITKKKELEADEVIVLVKNKPYGILTMKNEGYHIKCLKGDFFDILKQIKDVFDEAKNTCFIAGENELDIYVTFYLSQLQKAIPFYVIDENKLVLLPINASHGFTGTNKK